MKTKKIDRQELSNYNIIDNRGYTIVETRQQAIELMGWDKLSEDQIIDRFETIELYAQDKETGDYFNIKVELPLIYVDSGSVDYVYYTNYENDF